MSLSAGSVSWNVGCDPLRLWPPDPEQPERLSRYQVEAAGPTDMS